MKYYIHTFGCQQNEADSERITTLFKSRGLLPAESADEADYYIINTCMVRKMAEDRIYGLINNLSINKSKTGLPQKIIVTGCMVGMAVRDKNGKFLKRLKEILPQVDEFLSIEEVGFEYTPLRENNFHALTPISQGCNNYCSFCVVPFARGKEKSRPYKEILDECKDLALNGFKKITLLGMNVNSYGSDLISDSIHCHSGLDTESILIKNQFYILPNGKRIKPILVKHLGKTRIPTLFPYLLDDICKIKGIKEINFMSSNPWDFSDELIDVVARNPKITRQIHLAVQSGNNSVLKRMNRWYTKTEYLYLVKKIRKKIPGVKISSDFIVGFCEETEKEFKDSVDLAKKAKFNKAYIAMYSDRPMTHAHKNLKDNVPYKIKKRRWQILENLINKPNLKKSKVINIK